MAKAKKRKQNRFLAFFNRKKQLLPAAITIVFIASMGAYWVVQSFAATSCPAARTGLNSWGTLSPSSTATPNTTFTYSWHIYVSDFGGSGCFNYSVQWEIQNGFTTHQTVAATINSPTSGTYTVRNMTDANQWDVPISFTIHDPLGCAPSILIHVTATDGQGNVLPESSGGVPIASASTCPGETTTGDPTGDPQGGTNPGDPSGGGTGGGVGDANPAPPAGNGQAPNNTKQNNSSSTASNSPSPSATTQSNKPNTVPSSTAQGTAKEQATIKPSPFFDGKLYTTGSDAKKVFDPSVSFAGKKIPAWGLYTITLVLIAGIVGFVWWWRRRQRKTRKR